MRMRLLLTFVIIYYEAVIIFIAYMSNMHCSVVQVSLLTDTYTRSLTVLCFYGDKMIMLYQI